MDDEFITLIPTKYTVQQQLRVIKEDEIVLRHGHIAITNYHMGDNPEFEKSLSSWNKTCFRYEMKGGFYIKQFKEFRISRAYNIKQLVKYFPHHKARVDNDAYPCDKIDIKLMQPPRDDFQKVAITFMASQGEYKGNARFTQQMIDMPTGSGKLYCGIASSAFLSARTVIIVPISKLLDQWKNGFLEFTDLKEKDIMIVQGSKACEKIIAGKCKDVKIFIFMVDTIQSFIKSHGALEAIEMFRATNAYTKIIDEAHKDMKSIAMIEAVCNFRMNYYMSASPGRADSKENWIYRTLYYNMPKFGSNFMTQEEKHLTIMIKRYTFTPDNKQIKKMVNNKVGMNSKLYEKELVNAPAWQRENFDQAVTVMLNWSKGLVKGDNKIMIMAGTIDMLHYLKELAEKVFPDQVSEYHGSLTDAEKAKALEKKVIVATSTSLGTGANIAGLQHIYNVSTYSNWLDAIQLPGRGRKLKDNTQVVYCEFVNYGYRKTIAQYERRKPYLIKSSKSGKIMVIY